MCCCCVDREWPLPWKQTGRTLFWLSKQNHQSHQGYIRSRSRLLYVAKRKPTNTRDSWPERRLWAANLPSLLQLLPSVFARGKSSQKEQIALACLKGGGRVCGLREWRVYCLLYKHMPYHIIVLRDENNTRASSETIYVAGGLL